MLQYDHFYQFCIHLFCLYINKHNNTWARKDMEFIFLCLNSKLHLFTVLARETSNLNTQRWITYLCMHTHVLLSIYFEDWPLLLFICCCCCWSVIIMTVLLVMLRLQLVMSKLNSLLFNKLLHESEKKRWVFLQSSLSLEVTILGTCDLCTFVCFSEWLEIILFTIRKDDYQPYFPECSYWRYRIPHLDSVCLKETMKRLQEKTNMLRRHEFYANMLLNLFIEWLK